MVGATQLVKELTSVVGDHSLMVAAIVGGRGGGGMKLVLGKL
jgi:hypothetical protein